MKTLIISVVLCYSLFAQENSDRQEFFMMTENTPVPVTFDLEKLGTTYCYYEDYIPITFEICEDCDPCNDCEGGIIIVGSPPVNISSGLLSIQVVALILRN